MLLTNDERGAKGTLAGIVRSSAADIFAGLVGSVISVAYGLSFAAVIFAPPLNTWLAYGIAPTVVTMAIGAAVVSARSSLPFAVAGPDPTTVAVTATLVSALMARFAVEGAPDDLLAPVIIIMAMAAALSGVFLLGLGCARGRCHSLHSLPRHRRIPRRHRLPHGERRRARDHRPRHRPLAARIRQSRQACGGERDRRYAPLCAEAAQG